MSTTEKHNDWPDIPSPVKDAEEAPAERPSSALADLSPKEDHPTHAPWKPYAALFAGWCALFASFGYTSSFGVYQTWYSSRFPNTSEAVISLIGGLQVACQYTSGLVVGRAVDKFGPRKVTAAGALLCTFALMMLSLSTRVWHVFLTQGVLYGLGMSSLFMPTVACALTWFNKHKTVAACVVLSGSSVGGVVWPVLVEALRGRVGWGWTNRVIGFIVMALCTCTSTLISSRQKPDTAISLIPDFSLFKRPQFSFLVAANLFGYFSIFSVFFFIEARARQIGVNPSLAPYVISILNGSSAVLRFIPAFSADYLGPLNTWVAVNTLSVIFMFAIWIPINSTAGVVAIAVLWALSAGGWVGCLPSCVRTVAGAEHVASSMGIFYFSSVPGALGGTSIGGLFLDDTQGGFQRAGIFWGCMQLCCLLCAICSRISKNRQLYVKE